MPAAPEPVDLVLSGGGVKGIGLVGAVVALLEAGHTPHRVSGTSAGSIVSAIVVASAQAGRLHPAEVKDLALGLDYAEFLDPGPLERVPFAGPAVAILRGTGIYRGDYARDWVAGQLRDLGVHTFGDLRINDDDLPPERRYRAAPPVGERHHHRVGGPRPGLSESTLGQGPDHPGGLHRGRLPRFRHRRCRGGGPVRQRPRGRCGVRGRLELDGLSGALPGSATVTAMSTSAIVPLPADLAGDGAVVFAPLAGPPPLVRVVQLLAPTVVVAAAARWVDAARECLTRYGMADTLVVTPDGETASRAECIAAGLAHLRGASRPPQFESAGYVLIHDHRHPLAPPAVRDRVIAALRAGAAAVVPAQPFTDSAKLVDRHGSITATVDRSTLRTAQYPRGFTAAALAQLVAARATGAFDEVAAALRAGVAVTLVDGDPDGATVDLPRAGRFVEAVIASRPLDRR